MTAASARRRPSAFICAVWARCASSASNVVTAAASTSALANVHRLFVESRWEGADLHSLAKEELAAYQGREQIDGPSVTLEPNAAQAIAVILHELATNAAKYGALSVPNGHVRIEWSHEQNGQLVLRWTEKGGPPVEPPTRRGFGARVMENMVRGLKGELHFDWHPEGRACEIVLPP